jgi:hypothetical protein
MRNNLWNTVVNPLNIDTNPLSLHFLNKKLESEFTNDYKNKNVTLVLLFTILSFVLFSLFYFIYTLEHPAWFVVMIVWAVVFGLIMHFRWIYNIHYLALFSYSLIIELSYNHRILFYVNTAIGYPYLSTDYQSPCKVKYSPSAIGKTVAYRLRWTDNRGNCGAWSETHNVTINI